MVKVCKYVDTLTTSSWWRLVSTTLLHYSTTINTKELFIIHASVFYLRSIFEAQAQHMALPDFIGVLQFGIEGDKATIDSYD